MTILINTPNKGIIKNVGTRLVCPKSKFMHLNFLANF